MALCLLRIIVTSCFCILGFQLMKLVINYVCPTDSQLLTSFISTMIMMRNFRVQLLSSDFLCSCSLYCPLFCINTIYMLMVDVKIIIVIIIFNICFLISFIFMHINIIVIVITMIIISFIIITTVITYTFWSLQSPKLNFTDGEE